MILQLTVFLQNEKGRLSSMCRTLADSGINMHAMFLADTQDFGIARVFCDHPEDTATMLAGKGFRASVTPVNAVRVRNEPGGLAHLLEFCDENDMNIEYGYCFLVKDDSAIDVLKVDGENVDDKLAAAGFTLVKPEEIYAS